METEGEIDGLVTAGDVLFLSSLIYVIFDMCVNAQLYVCSNREE